MYRVGLDDAQKRLRDLVNAALRGEDVFIVKDDEQTVRLTSVDKAPLWLRPGSLRRSPAHLSSIFRQSFDHLLCLP